MLHHFDIAHGQHDPMAPRDELQTIEAPSALAALELLKTGKLHGGPGISTVWIRVVVAWNENGTPRQVLKVNADLRPIALDN